jgi:hypothetical protein
LVDRVTHACSVAGSYTLSAGTTDPALVLQRMMDALSALAPELHCKLTGAGGIYTLIPPEALTDGLSAWWETSDAETLLLSVTTALNQSAPKGFVCVWSEGDRFELVRIEANGQPAAEARPPTAPPHSSAVRPRVRLDRS